MEPMFAIQSENSGNQSCLGAEQPIGEVLSGCVQTSDETIQLPPGAVYAVNDAPNDGCVLSEPDTAV